MNIVVKQTYNQLIHIKSIGYKGGNSKLEIKIDNRQNQLMYCL